MNIFAFTCGDTNGIGPEIVIKALNKIYEKPSSRFYFICPENIFQDAVKLVKPDFRYSISNEFTLAKAKEVAIITTGKAISKHGIPTSESGKAAFNSIHLSGKLALEKKIDAIITAPISKEAIHSAGHKFPGHTEMLAEWCGRKNFVMTFLSERMNSALATIHVPIKDVPGLITKRMLREKIEVIFKMLKIDLGIKHPRVAVLGLNPHAGENGIIGIEEKKILLPLVKSISENENLAGPFSPDAFFANSMYQKYDLVFGMYHDQVLIPFKTINFGTGVNYTAGLQIVRTSPDHGTAFDIAWKNKASESSLLQAFKYAEIIVKNRKKNIES